MDKNTNSTEQVAKIVKTKITHRNRKLAKLITDNLGTREVGKSTQELILAAGYSPETARQQSALLRSDGLKLALAELGLTKEKIVPMLMDDLNNNPGRRWLGLSIAGKWLGLEQRDAPQTQNNLIGQANIVIQLPPKE